MTEYEKKVPHSLRVQKKDKYLIIGKMGLMYSIEKGWIDTGMEETPEEMIDLIMSAITAF